MSRYSTSTPQTGEHAGRHPHRPTVVEQTEDPEILSRFLHVYPYARRAAQIRAAYAVATGSVPTADAEDIVQEVLLAIWRALHLFDSRRGSLRTFVERVVTARLVSLHRSRGCRPRWQPITDSVPSVAVSWAAEIELRADVQRVLACLPESERQIALALTEYTPTQVARLMGITRNTVYVRIRRIRSAFLEAGLYPCRHGSR
jgi:RNA polymerase sigma factor (sigma-70 family)